eukprot:SAG31_NODE_1054_length_10140_cov_4.264316_10_plen_75_part_00
MKTELTRQGDESVWSFTWEVEEHERPHGWFLIAADCALEQYNAKVHVVFGLFMHRVPGAKCTIWVLSSIPSFVA